MGRDPHRDQPVSLVTFCASILRRFPGWDISRAHCSYSQVIGLLGYRVWKQQAFLQQVRTSRLDPVELKRMLDGGQSPYIDLTCVIHSTTCQIPGATGRDPALTRDPDAAQRGRSARPRRDPVLHLSQRGHRCPDVIELRQNGIYRVRPLLGGADRWKKLGYPLETPTRNSRQASPDSAVRKHSGFPPLRCHRTARHFHSGGCNRVRYAREQNSCQGGEFAQRIEDNFGQDPQCARAGDGVPDVGSRGEKSQRWASVHRA